MAGSKGTETVESKPVGFVEFTGIPPYGRHFHGRRIITREQFAEIDILVDRDYEFSESAGWTQEIDPENTALVEYFHKTDRGFQVTGIPQD